MKIGLGTAQLSKNYGLLKQKVAKNEIIDFFKILNQENFIGFIDTSPSYNKSESIIGKYLKRKINISSKINPFIYDSVEKNIDRFKLQLDKSLKNLRTDNIYGMLFHDDNNIHHKNEKFFYFLDNLKKNKVIKKIGFSTYDVSIIPKKMEIYNFNLVQVPLNIFNLHTKTIKNLKSAKQNFKLEIHARSIFLQGLGLKDKVDLKKFNLLNKKLKLLKDYEKKLKTTKYQMLLSIIFNLKFIDKCIIGCSSIDDLRTLKNFESLNLNLQSYKNILIKNKFILDPRKW